MASAGAPPAMRSRTPSVKAGTRSPRGGFSPGPGGPAGTWWTRSPGSTRTTGGWAAESARVYTSHSTPARASAAASSRTYTFMPPPSPDPGWARGEVCMERTASVRTAGATLYNVPKFLRARIAGRKVAAPVGVGVVQSGHGRRDDAVFVLVPEGEVDAHEHLLLLL